MIDKEPTGFIDPDLVPWQPEAGIVGLYAKTLSRCGATGSYTRLLKLLPGTDTSGAGVQSHDHLEELWLVEGALYDLSLDQNFTTGMYANRLYHMDHGPWRAPDGAVTFELRDNDREGRITKQQLEFFDPSLEPWNAVDDDAGVYVKTLTECPATGSYGRLIKLRPGATEPRTISGENGRSEIWIIAGQLEDRRSRQVHATATYGNVDVDLLDGGWTSPAGCVLLEVRNRI